MLVKFTKRGRIILVNVSHVTSVDTDIDHKSNSELKTRIFFSSGQSTYVDEPLNQVHEMLNKAETKCLDMDYSYDNPTIDARMQESYDRHRNQQEYHSRNNRNDYRGRNNSYDRYERY